MLEDAQKEEKILKIQSPEWVHDVLPDDHEYFGLIKKVVRHRSRQSWFRRITPPVFEDKNLFIRSIWDETDIVEKELYTFSTKSWKTYALRPELTAWVIRAYIEHWMASLPQPVHLYSFEPVFRHDRPQKWRYRQFFQYNIEVIWESDPWIDAQIIHMAWQILKDLKIEKNIVVLINSLWSLKERDKFKEDLKNYLKWRSRVLCEDCIRRLENNPLRVLDCKNEDCKLIALKAPKMSNYLSDNDKEFHKDVLDLLDSVWVPYEQTDSLVRWLDYYSKTIFEFVEKDQTLRQWSLIWWWGYDWLVELLWWNEKTPWVWFAFWVERIVARMKEFWVKTPTKDVIHVFVAQIWKQAKLKALPLIEKLQNLWIHTMWAVWKPSIKWQMRMADKFNAWYTLIMWQVEVRDWTIIFRDMKKWSQEIVPFEEAVDKIIELIWENNFDKTEFLEEIYLDPPKLDEDGQEIQEEKKNDWDVKCKFN